MTSINKFKWKLFCSKHSPITVIRSKKGYLCTGSNRVRRSIIVSHFLSYI